MAVGGLAIVPTRAALVEKRLAEIRDQMNIDPNAEIKWSTAKRRRNFPHLAYLDYMFDLLENNHAHLHIRLSPFKDYEHSASGDREETDTVSKSFYQLLLHRAGRFYGEKCRIIVRSDAGDCTSYLPKFQDALNNDISTKFGCRHWPIVDIAPRDSKSEPLLQLLDVTLGAITAVRNGSHLRDGASEAKVALMERAIERGKIVDVTKSHPWEDRAFNLWNVTPKYTKGAVPTR
jgi:hypothetical protein